MTQDEVEAVLGHEISHVANGDMITMDLIQGVLNTFVLFISRVTGTFVHRVIFKNERGFGIGYFVVSIIAELILGVFAAMIAALQRLQQSQQEATAMPDELAVFGISGGLKHGIAAALMTHPPLEKRILALKAIV